MRTIGALSARTGNVPQSDKMVMAANRSTVRIVDLILEPYVLRVGDPTPFWCPAQLHTGIDCLELGQDVVEVVQVLDAGGKGVGVIADDRGCNNRQPLLVELPRVHLDRIGDDENRGVGALVG